MHAITENIIIKQQKNKNTGILYMNKAINILKVISKFMKNKTFTLLATSP